MAGAAPLLFRDPDFRALWIGQLISTFGDRFTYLALLAVVIDRARVPASPAAELALIPVVSFLPGILFGPWFGALVDGWDRRRVVVVSDAARGLIVLLFLPAVPWGGLTAAFALIFLLYVANTFFLPARSAILPDLVPRERLVEANSLSTAAGVAGTITGSLAGGWAVAALGWRAGFVIDAATYFASAIALAQIRKGRTPPRARRGPGTAAYRALLAETAEGARIALRSRAALGAIAAFILLWMAGGALHVAAPILLAARGSGIVAGVGALVAATSGGMVVGSLGLAVRGARGSPWTRIAVGLTGAGLLLALFARSRSSAADLALGFGAGMFVAVLLVTTEAALQNAVGAEARGRVFALRDFAARILVLAAAGISGFLVSRGAVSVSAVTVGAGLLLATAGIVLGVWIRRGNGRSAGDAGRGGPVMRERPGDAGRGG